MLSPLIEPLSEEDGGGFFATVPDLPGCMSDGETPEEALVNVQDAILAWIEAATDMVSLFQNLHAKSPNPAARSIPLARCR